MKSNTIHPGNTSREKPTKVTYFSGGGLEVLGSMAAGCDPVDAVEFDSNIASVYADNIGKVTCARVEDVNPKQWDGVDCFGASPSCKSFSQANVNGAEHAQDLSASAAVSLFIKTVRPKYVIVENVSAYRHSVSFANICKTLDECGYGYDSELLNFANIGVPQSRRRLILRAVRGGRVPAIVHTHNEFGTGGLARWCGWYAAIEDIVHTLPESKFAPWQEVRLREQECKETFLMMTGNTNIDNPTGSGMMRIHEPANTVVAGHHSLQSRAYLVGDQYATFDGNDEQLPQIAYDTDPSFTVTSNKPAAKYRASLAPGRVVKMTIQAMGRFQTLPDSYRGATMEIIGNGVPCRGSEHLWRQLLGVETDQGIWRQASIFDMGAI